MTRCELALTGGRVIDPESGLDAVRTVGVSDGRIVAVTSRRLDSARTEDVSGFVVAPGFIDLHSHAQTLTGARLQALDGVTTALELEAGALPVAATYDEAARHGHPIHFGYSSSWALARLAVRTGKTWSAGEGTPIEFSQRAQAAPGWLDPATPGEIDAILDLIDHGLTEGGIGVGVMLGYAPSSDPEEFRRVAELAARRGHPVFAHSRTISMTSPGTSFEGVRELVRVAETTRTQVHICHLNSTSLSQIAEIADFVREALVRGVPLTTETYPYGSGSTGIGADFFAPERFARLGVDITALTYLPTGERIADLDRLAHLRATDPGGLCIIDYLDPSNAGDLALLLSSITLPGGMIASDAMPLTLPDGRTDDDEWPLLSDAIAHPRSAGTFSRALRWLVRELGVLTLPEAIARMSLEPARLLQGAVPAMRTKGRVQPGADADLTIFDPATVTDTATFTSLTPSTGVQHVLVDGTFVVENGRLDLAATPGRAIRSGRRG